MTVGGSAVSTISTGNGRADHLDANTVFNVADATGSSATDLLVSAPLRNQSGDFASAAGGLTKTGAGTMEIASGNTSSYTGATTVNAGTLLVNGSISGSTTTISGTGTLGGSGTVGVIALNGGGTLAPGNSPGIMNAGNTTFNGGTFAIEITGATVGTQYDQLSVTGSVSLASNTPLTLDFSTYDPADNTDVFTIILNDTASDAVTGTGLFTYAGNPLAEGAIFNALSGANSQDFSISYAGGDGNDVVLAAIPEPGAFLSLIGGAGVLVGLRRFRRRA